jgi:hypothetical protein
MMGRLSRPDIVRTAKAIRGIKRTGIEGAKHFRKTSSEVGGINRVLRENAGKMYSKQTKKANKLLSSYTKGK